MEKELQSDFLEIENSIKARIGFLESTSYDKKEIEIRKNELEIIRKVVNKYRYYRFKPLEELSTVRGITLKIGDEFHIAGDLVTTYKVVSFPDGCTVRGSANNPLIGKPWICEAYIEEVVKKKNEEKACRIRLPEKPKKVNIEVGEYFSTRTNNTVYKAIKVKKKKVFGTNELTAKNAPKQIGTLRTEIIIKTKKDYKNQHKAEKKFKE